MKVSGAGLWLTALCLATVFNAVASAEPTTDRLFVVVSPVDAPGPSEIVAFDIESNGVPVQAESYPTGGNGSVAFSNQGIVVDSGGRFVFVAHNESNSIAVFEVQPDGTLETVGGSPFTVGVGTTTYRPVFLAPTPGTSFLYAAGQGALVSFEVADDGALGMIQSLPVTSAGIAISPAGDYLYAAGLYAATVHAYRITASGLLEELDGSPFDYDASRPWQVAISSDGERLWILDLDTGIAAFDIGGDGALQLSGQTPVGTFAAALELTADNRFLYAAPPFVPGIYGFATDGVAPLALPGSPFPAEYTAFELLGSPDGMRLYQVTGPLASILPMAIEANGELSALASAVAVVTDDGSVPNGATYFSRSVLDVEIDVRPGSERNQIRLCGHGVVPVGILGAAGFDVADVDQASVRLGPGGAIPAHHLPHQLRDIDGDGHADLVLHFRTDGTGLACGDTTVVLTGLTFDNREFSAIDAIEILGCAAGNLRSAESRHGRRDVASR